MADLTTKQIYTFGDSFYLLSASGTWGAAQAEAQSVQGNLVTINNAEEQTFLAGLFAGQALWIGYTDSGVEGSFEWVNGENSTYTNWAPNQPDEYRGQDFVILDSLGSWDDTQGTTALQGIIEIKNPATPILVIEDLGVIEPTNGSRQAVFTVRRYGNSSGTTTVNYSTANGTTVAGSNYTAASGTLIFNPGETVKPIAVTVSQDADVVSGETFFVNLSNSTNAILGDNQAKATLREAAEAVTFNGNTYLLTNPGNWGQAQAQARSFGGNLVTINSAEEQTFLAGKYTGQNLWIGYSDSGKEWNATTGEGFQWISGTGAYTNWAPNQPDEYRGEDFVILSSNGNWNDVSGSSTYRGIIEVPGIVNPPVALPPSPPPPGGNSNDTLTGNPGNKPVVGTGNDDVIVCSNGRDTLTGGTGADRFLYTGNTQSAALQKSSVTALDRITDFNAAQGDHIWLDFDNNRNTVELPKKLFNAKDVTGKTLANAVKSAYGDKNYKLSGKQTLSVREAVFFEWRNHTYLSVNDTRGQFTVSRDLVIDVTGIQMSRQDTISGTIAVSKYFV